MSSNGAHAREDGHVPNQPPPPPVRASRRQRARVVQGLQNAASSLAEADENGQSIVARPHHPSSEVDMDARSSERTDHSLHSASFSTGALLVSREDVRESSTAPLYRAPASPATRNLLIFQRLRSIDRLRHRCAEWHNACSSLVLSRIGQRSCAVPLTPLTSTVSACVAFNCDGTLLAATHGGGGHLVRLFDTATGGLKAELRGHSRTAWSLTFSKQDPYLLASGCLGKTTLVWCCRQQVLLYRLAFTLPISSLTFNPVRDFLFISSGNGVFAFDARQRDYEPNHPLEYAAPAGADTASSDRFVRLNWSQQLGAIHIAAQSDPVSQEREEPDEQAGASPTLVRTLTFSPDGQWMGLLQSNYSTPQNSVGTFRLWNIAKKHKDIAAQPALSIQDVLITCMSCRVSPDGQYLTAATSTPGSEGSRLLLVSLRGSSFGQVLCRYDMHSQRYLSSVRFSFCSKFVGLAVNSWHEHHRTRPRLGQRDVFVLLAIRQDPSTHKLLFARAWKLQEDAASGNDVAFQPFRHKYVAIAMDKRLSLISIKNVHAAMAIQRQAELVLMQGANVNGSNAPSSNAPSSKA